MKKSEYENIKCNCCGRTYEDLREFRRDSSYVGTMETNRYLDHNLELRNCACGSTLSVPLDPTPFNLKPGWGISPAVRSGSLRG